MSTSLGFDDTLEPLGLATGVFLVLAGVMALVGMPWTAKQLLAGLLQSLGGVFAIAVGAGIVWIARK